MSFPVSQTVASGEKVIFSDEVPVPPDTLSRDWAENVEGYVPSVYPPKAPDPPSVLRPRYLPNTPEQGEVVGELKTFPPAKVPVQDIVQVSGGDDPFLSVPALSFPATQVQAPPVPESFLQEYRQQNPAERPMDAPISPEDAASGASPYAINNRHTCDELTCGGIDCHMNRKTRHLNSASLRSGVCDGCGLLTCARKTRGPWFFDGWVQVGSFMNTHWPDNRSNTPLYFNDRNGEAVMNQLYFSFGRRTDSRKGDFDIGGRIDLLYGTDYFHTSSLGLETRRQFYFGGQTLDPLEAVSHWNSNRGHRRDGTAALYGLSMPQAYAEVFVPFGHGVTVKAGHFYSGMSLESAMAPQNFFYSHSYNFMHGTPTTLTGATATIGLNSRTSLVAGFTEGCDVFDSPTGRINGLFGLNWNSRDKRSSVSFMLHTGEDTLRGNDNRTIASLMLQQKIGHRWLHSQEYSFGYEKNGAFEDVATDRRGPARWISIVQYLQWQWTETLSLGFRAEWFRDDGHTRIQKSPVSMDYWNLTGKDYFELTLGLNWKPTRYVTIRPEVRYDCSDVKVNGRGGAYNGFSKREMVSFAIDGIFRF